MKGSNKEKYRELCKAEKTIPIFSRDWWLDAVCGEGNWDVALVENNGNVIASFPYYKRNMFGFQFIGMPKITQTMGIWVKYPENQTYAKRLSFEHEIFNILIEKLPSHSYFEQNFHYKFTNWLPFYWKGFQQTTRYTYVIEDLSDLEKLFSNMKKQLRRDVRKSKNSISIISEDNISRFYEINRKTFERQKVTIPYSFDFIKRIDHALKERDARRILFAIDNKGNTLSALYLVWDDCSCYTLLEGSDPEFRRSNANSLLNWEAIKCSASMNKKHNFTGSVMQSIETFIRGFGGIQKPYFNISKSNSNFFSLAKKIKAVINR